MKPVNKAMVPPGFLLAFAWLSGTLRVGGTVSEGLPKKAERSISANMDDLQCLENFEVSDKTIIRTKESQAAGALYINETELETFDTCLRYCCQTPLCNVAVFDKQVPTLLRLFCLVHVGDHGQFVHSDPNLGRN